MTAAPLITAVSRFRPRLRAWPTGEGRAGFPLA
jgi:hypothetical protein